MGCAMSAIALIQVLGQSLPGWHFQPYGKDGAVACYPPSPPNADAFNRLSALAPITSVCGPLYVVTGLRN
jgi:hypothetical protein